MASIAIMSPVAVTVMILMVAIVLPVTGRIFPGIPVVSDEIDPLATGVVSVAMFVPVLGVPRRDAQIDWRAAHRYRFDDDRPGIDHGGRGVAADVDTAVEAGLADAHRYSNVAGKH